MYSIPLQFVFLETQTLDNTVLSPPRLEIAIPEDSDPEHSFVLRVWNDDLGEGELRTYCMLE